MLNFWNLCLSFEFLQKTLRTFSPLPFFFFLFSCFERHQLYITLCVCVRVCVCLCLCKDSRVSPAARACCREHVLEMEGGPACSFRCIINWVYYIFLADIYAENNISLALFDPFAGGSEETLRGCARVQQEAFHALNRNKISVEGRAPWLGIVRARRRRRRRTSRHPAA